MSDKAADSTELSADLSSILSRSLYIPRPFTFIFTIHIDTWTAGSLPHYSCTAQPLPLHRLLENM